MRNGEKIELPSKTTYSLLKGDVIRIETPGGGGYGDVKERLDVLKDKDKKEGRVTY